MKTFLTRTYVWLLLFYELKGDTSEFYFDVFNEMADLHELCPFSTFCDVNVTSDAKENETYVPCCKSCSCDADCDLRGDCCFNNVNKNVTKETESMICVSTVLAEPSFRNTPHFRMVSKCSTNFPESESLCGQNTTSFGPVVSLDTGLIYYNRHCAECNGANNTITWKLAFTCRSDSDILLVFIDSFMNGKSSSFHSVCFAYYIPPSGLNLASQACDPYVVRKCNATGFMKNEEPYWRFCEMFNGTYTQVEGDISFGNVYCYLCNVDVQQNLTNEITDKWCPNKGDGFQYNKINAEFPLTVFLNSVNSQKNVAPKTEIETNQCPENSRLVESHETSCRPLECPWGQMRLNNQCGYHSNSWVGGPFAVMLKLTPVRKNVLIPSSFFTEMPTTDRYDRKAKWLERNALNEWNFVLLYHKALETSFVDFIVVKATYPSTAVNPNHLAIMVKRDLKDFWFMEYGNTTIALKVTFNKYNLYGTSFLTFPGSIHSKQDQGFCPLALLCPGRHIKNYACFEELINPILPIFEEQLNEGIFVTKMFFCDQIKLLPEDFFIYCHSVILRVKHISLYLFSEVRDQFNGDIKVRVCVDDLPLIGKAASKMTACSAELFAIIITAVCFLN